MTRTPADLRSVAFAPSEPRSNHPANPKHYEVAARRIAAALRSDGQSLVLVTSDPPADARVLCAALGGAAARRYQVVDIPCRPGLNSNALGQAFPGLAAPTASSGETGELGYSAPASPLFVFDDFNRLSDSQIAEIYDGTPRGSQIRVSAVLLAPSAFLARLEQPALHFLKARIAAQIRFGEIGDDEAIAFLHRQLLSHRDRRIEARGFRRGIAIGLSAGAVAIVAAGIGAFVLYPTVEQVHEAPAGAGGSGSVRNAAPLPQTPAKSATSIAPQEAAPRTEATSALAMAAPPPAAAPLLSLPPQQTENPSQKTAQDLPPKTAENLPPAAPSTVVRPPAAPGLSTAEIAALLARGDALLGTGDITSARLFYERAADADSGLAALRLGSTYDMVFPGPAGLRAPTADPIRALFWYRRARELGVGAADPRIKALEAPPSGAIDARSR